MTLQPSLFDTMALPTVGGAHLRLHTPALMTKELGLQRTPAGRKLRLSSNVLAAFGFAAGTRIERRVLGTHQGLEFRVDPAGATKVYERHYPSRTNNPAESQLDVNSQADLDAAFPGFVQRVHFTMEPGRIVAVPVIERAPAIRAGIRQTATPLTAFVALSSGVDAYCLTRAGFACTDLLEYRPTEKRDLRPNGRVRDLTETGVLTAIQNVPFARVWNEDLRTIDLRRVERALAGGPPTGLLHISVQCDDFSAAKGKALRAAHVADGDTTIDLTHDALNLIAAVRSAVVMIENVPAYLTSFAGQMLMTKLRRWGYHVHAAVCAAPAFGGYTTRSRAYIVATVFDGFEFPAPTGARTAPLWPEIIADQVPHCRDITHTSSVQKGLAPRPGSTTPWIRLITPASITAGTVLKSQNRQAKDSLALRERPDGPILFPNETVLRRLNGIPDSFSLDPVGGEVATEIVGQSIDFGMHEAIAVRVRDHLLAAWQPAR